MNFRIRLLCVLAALVLSMHVGAQSRATRHEVQGGETLYSISRQYGLTVDQLRSANPQLGDSLLAGQVLTIPAASNAAATGTAAQAKAAAATGTQTSATGTTAAVPAKRPTVVEARPAQAQQVTAAATSVRASEPAVARTSQDPRTDIKQVYTVGKKETIYSIALQFGITIEALKALNPDIKGDKIRKGDVLNIPYTKAEIAAMREREEQKRLAAEAEQRRLAEAEARKKRLETVYNVAVVLPFALDEKPSKESLKMLDFYEGFLLAVSDMKARGMSANIYAYDEKSQSASSIDSILKMPMLAHANLIVGPMDVDNIAPLSRFARQHNIPLAVPFSTRSFVTENAPTTFQVNTLASTLYPQVYKKFISHYGTDANVVFCHAGDRDDKPGYIVGFKEALSAAGISNHQVPIGDMSQIRSMLSTDRQNVIVLSSSSQSAARQLVSYLNSNSSLDADYRIAIFGHPEWQTFSTTDKTRMQQYDAYFYSTFFTDTQGAAVRKFNDRFEAAFRRSQFQAVPLFGLLGYDVGIYFLSALFEQGTNFLEQVDKVSAPALQNPLDFSTGGGTNGFVNQYMNLRRL